MKLKKTDIIQAQMMPAFSEVLVASALLINEKAYFSYVTTVWDGISGDFHFEGRLSGERLADVRRSVELLDFDYSPSTWIEDVGSLEIGIRVGRVQRHFDCLDRGAATTLSSRNGGSTKFGKPSIPSSKSQSGQNKALVIKRLPLRNWNRNELSNIKPEVGARCRQAVTSL